jgi:hypothetical protein
VWSSDVRHAASNCVPEHLSVRTPLRQASVSMAGLSAAAVGTHERPAPGHARPRTPRRHAVDTVAGRIAPWTTPVRWRRNFVCTCGCCERARNHQKVGRYREKPARSHRYAARWASLSTEQTILTRFDSQEGDCNQRGGRRFTADTGTVTQTVPK